MLVKRPTYELKLFGIPIFVKNEFIEFPDPEPRCFIDDLEFNDIVYQLNNSNLFFVGRVNFVKCEKTPNTWDDFTIIVQHYTQVEHPQLVGETKFVKVSLARLNALKKYFCDTKIENWNFSIINSILLQTILKHSQ